MGYGVTSALHVTAQPAVFGAAGRAAAVFSSAAPHRARRIQQAGPSGSEVQQRVLALGGPNPGNVVTAFWRTRRPANLPTLKRVKDTIARSKTQGKSVPSPRREAHYLGPVEKPAFYASYDKAHVIMVGCDL